MTVIDLTHTIREDMPVYPGTEQPRLTTACTVSQCGYRETLLHMYSHTGTHIDAPAHMIDGALTLDGCGADRLMDPARYIGRCPQQVRALLDRIAPLLEDASSSDGGVSL